MDPIAAVLFSFISWLALDQEFEKVENNQTQLEETIKTQDNYIKTLEILIENLDNSNLKIAAAHSAHAARSNTIDDRHSDQIEMLYDLLKSQSQKIDYLEERLNIHHP